MRDGTAYVQAGGGVVADSNGPYEYTEATNKARAVLNAIAAAETLTAPDTPSTMRPGMADAEPDRAGRLTIRIAQVLLVVAAAGLWAASRLTWVDLRTFDGLGPPKLITLSGAAWSSALLPLALVLLATAVAALAVRGWAVAGARGAGGRRQSGDRISGDQPLEIPDVAVRGAELARVPCSSWWAASGITRVR